MAEGMVKKNTDLSSSPRPIIKKLLLLLIALIVLTACIVLYLNDPMEASFFPKCAFYQMTKIHCIGCGATRSLYHLMHGDFILAARNNIMLLILIPILLYYYIKVFADTFFNKSIYSPKIHPLLLKAFIAMLIAFWIVRNFPFFPFNLMTPIS